MSTPDRTPRPFECVCRGETIKGTVFHSGWNLRDYGVQFELGDERYWFTLIMSGLGTVPRHSVNCFFTGDAPDKRKFLQVHTQATEDAFEAAINAILEWREKERKVDNGNQAMPTDGQ